MFKKIQKLLVVSVIAGALSLSLLPAASVLAVDVLHAPDGTGICDKNPQATICQDENKPNPLFGPSGVITSAVKLLSLAAGILAVVVIIFQAIRIITSAGDSQSVTTARNGILYALVGLAIAVLAQALVAFVLNKLK